MAALWTRIVYFRFAKNNRSKSVWTLFQRKRLNNQTVWPVIFGLTGPICARALKSFHLFELRPRGHHDWPVSAVKLVDDLAGESPASANYPVGTVVISGDGAGDQTVESPEVNVLDG